MIGRQVRPNLVMRNMYREKFIEDDDESLRAFGDVGATAIPRPLKRVFDSLL